MKRFLRSVSRILSAVIITVGLMLLIIGCVYTQPTIGTLGVKAPIAANPDALRAHVQFLSAVTFPRDSDHAIILARAADYIATSMSQSGGRIILQDFTVRGSNYRNVVARFGPATGPVFVIGAHYDAFGELPAADDNASGVAGLLELGRLLGNVPPKVRIDLVAYCLEEPPFYGSTDMGSAVHARSLEDSHESVLGMASLEMIGYFAPEQNWNNPLLEAVYPNRGDFIMVVGRWHDRTLVRYLQKSMRGASTIPVRSLVTLGLPDVDASDHRNYWRSGARAVLVTDTAFIRNPNYHTKDDLPSTLNYDKMARVVDAMYGVAMNAGRYASGRRD